MYQKTTYENGLRLITKPLDSTRAVTVLVLVGAGSRYENKELNGISHFLEHMFFKGAKKYKNTQAVSEAIDGVGGEFNAFTGKEYAGYYIKVASSQLELALDVLSDMLIHSKFDPAEIEKERGVILEEYNMYQDTPMYQIGWSFESLLFGDQPLGWDQIGTTELIKSVTHEQFKKYQAELYTPDNIVIGICGKVDIPKSKELVQKYFNMPKAKKTRAYKAFKKPEKTEKLDVSNKKTEQAHIVVGVPSVPQQDPQEWTSKLLAVILGGNMSSRMFLNVREAQGLAYYISTSIDTYSDAGILSTRAGVDTTRTDQAIEAIINEYKKISETPVSQKELTKAKNYLKGKIVLKLEDSEEFAHLLCRHELLHGKVMTPDQINKKIDSVTVKDIHTLSKKLFKPENFRAAIIGPFPDNKPFLKILDQS